MFCRHGISITHFIPVGHIAKYCELQGEALRQDLDELFEYYVLGLRADGVILTHLMVEERRNKVALRKPKTADYPSFFIGKQVLC